MGGGRGGVEKGACAVPGTTRVHSCGRSRGVWRGRGSARAYPASLASLCLCDTQPSTPPGSAATWDERKAVVRTKGLASLADGTMQRWFTDEFKRVNPVRWREIRDTISGTTPEGSVGCMSAIQNFDYLGKLPTIKAPTLVICGDLDEGTPPDRNKLIAAKIPAGRYEGIAAAQPMPNVH